MIPCQRMVSLEFIFAPKIDACLLPGEKDRTEKVTYLVQTVKV